jgi:hypothetical protein
MPYLKYPSCPNDVPPKKDVNNLLKYVNAFKIQNKKSNKNINHKHKLLKQLF